jgi:hypothetical protein
VRGYGAQRLLKVPEQPIGGVISRLTLSESNGATGGEVLFLSWVVVREQVCTEPPAGLADPLDGDQLPAAAGPPEPSHGHPCQRWVVGLAGGREHDLETGL